jgi:glycosyltransferase involved in cell wall biosynthesis
VYLTGGLKTRGVKKATSVDMPLVSIVTAVFNGSRYLEQTIQSVLGQDYGNIEYVVIDDGSTDGSLDIIKKYDDRIDCWVIKENSGMYDSINHGLKSASGDILAYLNSDDLYYPDTVGVAVRHLQKHPQVQLVYGNCDFIDSSGRFLYRYHFPKYEWEAFISYRYSSLAQPATFWRRSVHEQVGYFDASFRYAGDFDFFAKAGKNCRFSHVHRTLARFRIHDDAMAVKLKPVTADESKRVNDRYADFSKRRKRFLNVKLYAKLKLLNLPLMFKKAASRLKRSARSD